MSDYQALYDALREAKADAWVALLPAQLANAFDTDQHGDLVRWQHAIQQLPQLTPSQRLLETDAVHIGCADDVSGTEQNQLEHSLRALHPWRKGPYQLFGIHIDTEWRSDWKWHRLEPHLAPLEHHLVLDVGCGNGYHAWRLLGAGAKRVIGIDPTLLSVMQFQAVKRLYGDAPIDVLPLALEDLPSNLQLFDTILSMGVLYHRRSPFDHLLELKGCLQQGGELVLETLVIEGGSGEVLVPEGRYARMRNVWFLPSCATLMSWMTRCGFKNVRLIDVTVTSIEEQRTTEWMQFHSLQDFLHPENPQLTCEGLPTPRRAIFMANA